LKKVIENAEYVQQPPTELPLRAVGVEDLLDRKKLFYLVQKVKTAMKDRDESGGSILPDANAQGQAGTVLECAASQYLPPDQSLGLAMQTCR
jgi:hypothetical protein